MECSLVFYTYICNEFINYLQPTWHNDNRNNCDTQRNPYLALLMAGLSKETGSPGLLKTFPLGLARGDVAPEVEAVSTESGTCLLPYSSSENKQTQEQ
jgi:hypothetical protein